MATQVTTYDGREVLGRRSAGNGVLYLEDWQDNVIRPRGLKQWPEALERQVNRYPVRRSWFESDDADALSAQLGRISKFQSLNSEDAITWSWFGTLGCADPDERRPALEWLYERLELDASPSTDAKIDQWMRVMHPNAPGSRNGPELDARVTDPGRAVIYVETKWHATFGTGKGAVDAKRDDQVVLRRDALRRDPELSDDASNCAVLVVSNVEPDLSLYTEMPVTRDEPARPVTIAWLNWSDLAECDAHPEAEEFRRYLDWKRERSGPAERDL